MPQAAYGWGFEFRVAGFALGIRITRALPYHLTVHTDPDKPISLQPFGTEIWIADDWLQTLGMTIPVRMTVIRLEDRRLFIHSPLALSPQLRAQLDALGDVRYVIAPNRFHHLFAADYGAYPDARLFLAPGLERKRTDLRYQALLGDVPPPQWSGQIDQALFRGAPLLNEATFFHRASRTLILTDLALNIHHTPSRLARWYFRINGVYGHLGQSWVIRLLTRDQHAARRAVEKMLQWDIECILMAHGQPVTIAGKTAFRGLFGWLLN